MKKSIFLFSFLLVFLAADAQIYTEGYRRVYNVSLNAPNPWLWGGGWGNENMYFSSVVISSRGQELVNKTFGRAEFPDPASGMPGVFGVGYHDASDVIATCIAGQEITIECTTEGNGVGWGNAALYIDWDDNGVFDDHDPYLYNFYDYSNCSVQEWAGQGGNSVDKRLKPKWTITTPQLTQPLTVRIRIVVDEGASETINRRANEHVSTHASCEYPLWWVANGNATYSGYIQSFYSIGKHRFMPTACGYRRTAVDLSLMIDPDITDPAVIPVNFQTVVGTGNAPDCSKLNAGTAINNANDFIAFLAATNGDFYLNADISITNELLVSQSEFSGKFNGNGHTITINPTTKTATIKSASKDDCLLPYGTDRASISAGLTNLLNSPQDISTTPDKAYAGGICGKLLKGGIIENVKIKYGAGTFTYQSLANSAAPVFGLVAGVNKGKIENVSVEIPAGTTVVLNRHTTNNHPSACAGITGILYRGIVKNCSFDLGGTFEHRNSGTAGRESILAGIIGRLQCGIVGNVKFSGSGTMKMFSSTYDHNCLYVGGVAGMTHTPQGHFCNDRDISNQGLWGYDNGTVGLDVNNVIIDYNGKMTMAAAASGTHNYYCRGLLFGESSDTIVVPNLYATSTVTRIANSSSATELSGTNIPLTSKVKGICNSLSSATPIYVGELYLYKDGRLDAANCHKYVQITKPANTDLDFCYEVDPTFCTVASRPYAIATNTEGKTNISNTSTNVTCGGADANGVTYAKIDAKPGETASWTWTNDPYILPVVPTNDWDCANPKTHGYLDAAAQVKLGTPISTAAELDAMAGKTGDFYLIADIPNAKAFSRARFNGTLYGNGHTIRFNDIMSNTVIINNGGYATSGGLFAGGMGNIRDLKIIYECGTKNVILGSGDAVAGLVMGATQGYIKNCSVTINQGTNLIFRAGTDGVGVGGVLGTSIGSPTLNNITVNNNGKIIAQNGWPWVAGFVASTKTNSFVGSNLILRGTGSFEANSANNSRLAGIAVLNGGNSSVDGFVYDFDGTMTGTTTNRLYVVDQSGTLSVTKYYAMTDAGGTTNEAEPSIPIYNKITESNIMPRQVATTTGYCTTTDKKTVTYRYTSSLVNFKVNGATFTPKTPIGTLQGASVSNADIYFDKTSTIIDIKSGETLEFYASGAGNWMHSFIYVDWNNDGDFNDGYTTSVAGEWVWNNMLSSNGPITGIKGPFTIPNGIPSGTYRVRYVCNWADNMFINGQYNPCQTTNMAANGGIMVDFLINVESSDLCQFTDKNGDVTPFLNDGVLSLVSCNATLTLDETISQIQDGCTVVAKGNAVPNENKVVVSTNAPEADNLYLVVKSLVTPKVTVRVGGSGGGKVSEDLGRTKVFTFTKDFYDKEKDFITAIPDGPNSFEGWFISYNNGVSFTACPAPVGKYIDFTYEGTADAILEARFGFSDYEGQFGLYKFTDVTTVAPYYIASIETSGAEVNIKPAETVFAAADIANGMPRWKYLDKTVSVREKTLNPTTVSVKVTMGGDMDNFSADTRLLCFIDFNNNRYFDFASSKFGTTADLTANDELVFVGSKTDASYDAATKTFNFTFNNDAATVYGVTRMRFFVGKFVDMYGLGPINFYNNLNFRYDTDSNGEADDNIVLNDNNGNIYTPNNAINTNEYVNVADVNFEVLAYIPYDKEWVIENGKRVSVSDLYIESKETVNGPQSGVVRFNSGSPYGSLEISGNIIIRKQIYDDRWHHISFPIDMQGSSATETYVDGAGATVTVDYKGIRSVNTATGETTQLNNSATDTNNGWITRTFDSSLRNANGYGSSANALVNKFEANKFYYFAADVDGLTPQPFIQDGTDGKYSLVQFYSVAKGFELFASNAQPISISYNRNESSPNYWDRNVNTLYNPYFSFIRIGEITSSAGWENITVWNAKLQRYEGFSAADLNKKLYPYIGYFVQFTEGIGTGAGAVVIKLGDNTVYSAVDQDRVSLRTTSKSALSFDFDKPDAFTFAIGHDEDKMESSTFVTLSEEGREDEFRAGYDMGVSYASATSKVPDLWTLANTSRMMFNDVQRKKEVRLTLGLRAKESGNLVLKLANANTEDYLVQLRDKQTGEKFDLLKDGKNQAYSFMSEAGDNDRFEVIISKPKSLDSELETVVESDKSLRVYVADNQLHLKNIPEGAYVRICDVLGRELSIQQIFEQESAIAMPYTNGVYLVHVLDKNGDNLGIVKVTNY